MLELSALFFSRWQLASEVQTFEELCELALLEQFKETLPERMATYLRERNPKILTEAAVIADEYALTHKVQGEKAIVAVQQHTKSTAVAAHAFLSAEPVPSPEESLGLSLGELSQADMTREVDPGYKPYVTRRLVSLAGSDLKNPY